VELLELNPAHVTEQRRVLGKRTIKTDVIDLVAMTELLLAGRGAPHRDRALLLSELTAWSAHRTPGWWYAPRRRTSSSASWTAPSRPDNRVA